MPPRHREHRAGTVALDAAAWPGAGRQPIGEDLQRRAGHAGRWLVGPAPRERRPGPECRLVEQLPVVAFPVVLAGVDLVHARIHGDPDRVGAGTELRARIFGHDHQAVDGDHRTLQAEGQALRHGTGTAQAGEGAGPRAEGHGIERRGGDAGALQQAHRTRDQARRGLRSAWLHAAPLLRAVAHTDGHHLGGRVDRKQPRPHEGRQCSRAIIVRPAGLPRSRTP